MLPCTPSPEQEQSLRKLQTLFFEKNRLINLSAIRSLPEIWEKHICDSLFVTKYIPVAGIQILDFGTGGGFPALPLAIFFPKNNITALDSVGKKLKCIDEMAHGLQLQNIHSLLGRGEVLAHTKKHREAYDVVVSRAAAKFPVVLEIASGFVKKNGLLCAYRGPESEENDRALIQKLGLRLQKIEEYSLSAGEKRTLWILQKEKPLSIHFPREVGIPKKFPLSEKK